MEGRLRHRGRGFGGPVCHRPTDSPRPGASVDRHRGTAARTGGRSSRCRARPQDYFDETLARYDLGPSRASPSPTSEAGGCRLPPRQGDRRGRSSINGMVYVRRPRDGISTTGPRAGGPQAGASRMFLPYFKRMENCHPGHHGGDPSGGGRTGPLHVGTGQSGRPRWFRPSSRRAGRPATRPTEDYNGEKQEGFRADGADGVARPALVGGQRLSQTALRRDNCRLVRGLAHRVVITEGRARGVEIARRGRVETIRGQPRK